MKIRICIAALITICTTSGAYADHRHGPSNECWQDTKYSDINSNYKWAYYYCGTQDNKCDGKQSKGHDMVYWQYHGDSFKFKTSPYETYFCCGGTPDAKGKYVQADAWIVATKTERMQVAGGTCNKQIKTDACGETHTVECTEPDSCNPGLILRNKACIAPCGDNQVYQSATSNTCIDCETTVYQGPSLDRNSCIKCDKDTEFFNRQTKRCVKKNGLAQYSNDALKKCWRCPKNDKNIYKTCVSEMSKPESQRGFAINNWPLIKKECHLD